MQQWDELKKWLLEHNAIDPFLESAEALKRLDLSGLGLESLPESFGLLDNLIALNLANNKLRSLPDSFVNLTSLSNLDIRRNRFEQLPSLLSRLPLMSINASFNAIKDATVLGRCASIRVIDLASNRIESFEGCLHPENEIRTINLSENYLEDVDGVFEMLSTAARIDFSGNQLTRISEAVKSLDTVEMLNLSDNQITAIDGAFFSLDVERVDLSANRLKFLKLEGLENLEELILDDNDLASLELAPDFAPYLITFSCESCNLDTFLLPRSVQLQKLCYASNQIERVPAQISRYTKLLELDLEGNRIVELPQEMENLTRLQTLYLGNNPLNNASKHVVEILHPDICDITMKTGIMIGEAKREDLAQMAQLLQILFAIEADFEFNYDKQLSGITKLFEHEGTDLLVARHDEKVVGMVTMQRLISSAEGDYIGQIEDLVVEESYRKMGVASRLINKIRFMAQEYGYKRIQLVADLDNGNAHRFYSRRGFRRTNLAVYHFQNASK